MTDLDKRAAAVQKELKELKKKIAKRDAEQRQKEQEEKLKLEARKDALFREFALLGTDPLLFVNSAGQTLDKWLTLPEDRAIFGFAP